jgi:hypothetical protein
VKEVPILSSSSYANVRTAHFHHNTGCGVVDDYPEVKVRYENCLIEHDTWRGGVEFHSGEFKIVNCVVFANPKKALTRIGLSVSPGSAFRKPFRCVGRSNVHRVMDLEVAGSFLVF